MKGFGAFHRFGIGASEPVGNRNGNSTGRRRGLDLEHVVLQTFAITFRIFSFARFHQMERYCVERVLKTFPDNIQRRAILRDGDFQSGAQSHTLI